MQTVARAELAIAARNLGKRYQIFASPRERLRQMVLRKPLTAEQEYWALRGVSLDVPKGQAIGVIGRNGSGKSTLLQLLAGTVMPTEGEARVRGRVAALLELGAGFNPEFTGRENVFLNGAILGLPDAEIDARFEEIETFADIGGFIEQPVKIYSSGMYVRLAFAVAACVDADILLVDEALAVGDVFFQQKCFEHIRHLQDKGVTILYVSHDMISVQTVCQRAVLLVDGRAAFDGDPSEAANRYFGALGEQLGAASPRHPTHTRATRAPPNTSLDRTALRRANVLRAGLQRHGARGVEIVAARIGEHGEDSWSVQMMQPLIVQLLLRATTTVPTLNAGFHIYDRFGRLVFATGSTQLGRTLPGVGSGDEIALEFRVSMEVQPGEYTLSLLVGEPSAGPDPNVGYVHDCIEGLGPVVVTASPERLTPFYGIARLPVSVTIDRDT